MRRLAVAATALVVAAGWLVVTAPTGRAAGALTTAWWWQGEPSRGAVPGPPTVPDGGLWVSSNATGPQAVSAVRVPLDAGDTAPVLTLTVHQAAPSGQVDLAAFPTTSAWAAGAGQAWASRPAYNPTAVAAAGTVSSDGRTVTFDLSGLVTGDALNVVLAPMAAAAPPPPPVPAPPQPTPPTFDMTFDKPGANAVRVTSAPLADVASPPPAPFADSSIDAPLPTESQAPFLPTSLEAPPSLAGPSTANPVASRPVALQNVARPLQRAVASKRSFADSAAIAVMLGLVLLWIAREGAPRSEGGIRRPRLTLYDAPKPAEAVAVARGGSAPPLR